MDRRPSIAFGTDAGTDAGSEHVRFADAAARYLVAYTVKRDGTPRPKSSLAKLLGAQEGFEGLVTHLDTGRLGGQP